MQSSLRFLLNQKAQQRWKQDEDMENISIALRCVGNWLEKIPCISKFASDNQCYFAISTVEGTQVLIENMVRSVLISLFVKLGHRKDLEKQTFFSLYVYM